MSKKYPEVQCNFHVMDEHLGWLQLVEEMAKEDWAFAKLKMAWQRRTGRDSPVTKTNEGTCCHEAANQNQRHCCYPKQTVKPAVAGCAFKSVSRGSKASVSHQASCTNSHSIQPKPGLCLRHSPYSWGTGGALRMYSVASLSLSVSCPSQVPLLWGFSPAHTHTHAVS